MRACQFGEAKLFGLLLESPDGGDGVAGLETLVVLVDFPANDGLCGLSFTAAVGEVGGGDLLEIVDVVDEAAFDLVHARVDVAWDGDVDEEHGTVAASVEEVLAVRAAEDLLRRSRAGDDDVGAWGLFVDRFEGYGFGVNGGAGEVGCDFFCARLSSVDDENGGCALIDEMTGGQFGHLSCAYEENSFSLQRTEDLSCEIDRYGGDGDAA